MNHRKLLQQANTILQERGVDYGDESELFERACTIYNLVTGSSMTPWEASMFMASLKLARTKTSRRKSDNYIDCINYLAFAAQFAPVKTGRVLVSVPLPEVSDKVEEDIKNIADSLAPKAAE
jgi:hypothetical protein